MIKISALENTLITDDKTGKQISVSTSARIYWRRYFSQQFGKYRNADLNEVIASDVSKATIIHRFLLKSGNIGEIRKSSKFYYVVSITDSSADVLVVQGGMKAVPSGISKQRLDKSWEPKQ